MATCKNLGQGISDGWRVKQLFASFLSAGIAAHILAHIKQQETLETCRGAYLGAYHFTSYQDVLKTTTGEAAHILAHIPP